MKKIDEQIEWYEQNATRQDDDIIRVNLQLINNLYEEIQHSDDSLFFDKIIGTFCEIIEIQRDVIDDLKTESGVYGFGSSSAQHNYIVGNSQLTEFDNDKQLQDAFTAYFLKSGKSSYTVNDYCMRLKKLWKLFFEEYQSNELPQGFAKEDITINEEMIKADTPLLNVYHYVDVIINYITKKIAACEGNRNLANTHAALKKFMDFKISIEK